MSALHKMQQKCSKNVKDHKKELLNMKEILRKFVTGLILDKFLTR